MRSGRSSTQRSWPAQKGLAPNRTCSSRFRLARTPEQYPPPMCVMEAHMLRPKRLPRCERRSLPRRLKAEIILRQDGRCADCGTRLIMGSFIFDHRPPLAMRAEDYDANDPER